MNSDSKNIQKNQVFCNLSNTQYEVVRYVCHKVFKWSIDGDFEDDNWELTWTDAAVSTNQLIKMKHFQKINHFLGMYAISQKNYLAINLNKLQKIFPEEYDFFPKTWVAPLDTLDLKIFIHTHQNSYLIVKPEASCQGRGIFLTRKIEEIRCKKYIAQEYVKTPYLIDGLKFDFRIYTLLTNCSPLRIFIFQEGLARFATQAYEMPNANNLNDHFMHLTNYAINKQNSCFVHNTDPLEDNIGHKRSLTSTMKYLQENGVDTEKLWKDIQEIIIKTICCIQPILAHYYNSCQPEDLSSSMCFEILGFDIMIDSNYVPYLLEVNHTPSFSTDSPLDWEIKKKLITDTLKILKISPKNRLKFIAKEKQEKKTRNLTGMCEKMTKEEKNEKREYLRIKKDFWEDHNSGNFKKIYPANGYEQYDKYIVAADNLWQEYTGLKVKKIKKYHIKKISPNSPLRDKQYNNTVQVTNNNSSPTFNRLSQPHLRKNTTQFSSKVIYPYIRLPKINEQHLKEESDPSDFTHSNFINKTSQNSFSEKVLRSQLPKIKKFNVDKGASLKEILLLEDLRPEYRKKCIINKL